MRRQTTLLTCNVCFLVLLVACSPDVVSWEPKEAVDLGTLVTEDLPERVFGKALLGALGNTRPNSFDVINFELEKESGS